MCAQMTIEHKSHIELQKINPFRTGLALDLFYFRFFWDMLCNKNKRGVCVCVVL